MEQDNTYIVLPDLDKKIDEAVYDAINFFEKKCPYCDSLLFTGHIRNKIHQDHFIPIAKGGQHVPWNILPACQRCNSMKNSKKPNSFLTQEKYQRCEKYLISVQDKYIGQIQIDLEKYARIKTLFSNVDSITRFKKNSIDLTKTIYEIVSGIQYEERIEQLPNELSIDFINYMDKVERNYRHLKSKLLNDVQRLLPHRSDGRKQISSIRFNKLVKQYCEKNRLFLNPHISKGKYDKRNSIEYYTIATEQIAGIL